VPLVKTRDVVVCEDGFGDRYLGMQGLSGWRSPTPPWFGDDRWMLILDNLEQVVSAASDLGGLNRLCVDPYLVVALAVGSLIREPP
jgi:hypothetical protein